MTTTLFSSLLFALLLTIHLPTDTGNDPIADCADTDIVIQCPLPRLPPEGCLRIVSPDKMPNPCQPILVEKLGE